MKHLYFLKTQKWIANGTYYDENEIAYTLRGFSDIKRTNEEWSLKGFLEVLSNESPIKFTNNYNISQTEKDATLKWESYNPALGTLRGTFEFIGNSIISFYKSEDDIYSGTEILILNDDKTYYNVGISFCNGKRMSSWTAKLEMV